MQAGKDLGVVIMVQTDAADQELLVYLPDHRAGAASLTLSHSDRHSKGARGPLNLHTQGRRNRRKVRKASRKQSKQGEGEEGVFTYPLQEHKEKMSHYFFNVKTSSKSCVYWHLCLPPLLKLCAMSPFFF